MTDVTLLEPEHPSLEDVVLSFATSPGIAMRLRRYWDLAPVALILCVQEVATWRLTDVANDDEALYIDAGHAMLRHLLHGTPTPDFGSYFSGAPALYPVLAGMLDGLGGLPLARLFSLACTWTASLCVFAIARRLYGRRAALCAILLFATAGSVLFVGNLATYDAPCLALLAVAVYLGVTRSGIWSGVPIGFLLGLAVATKYTGAALVPVVIGLAVLAPARDWSVATVAKATARGLTATVVMGGLLLAGLDLWGSSLRQGLSFTTTGRKALDHQPRTMLTGAVLEDVGLVLALALVGLALSVWSRRRHDALLNAAFIVGGMVLPLGQIRIHEFTSIDKHTAFSALFLAIPAGTALAKATTTRLLSHRVLVAALIWIVFIDGLWRSSVQYSWPASLQKVVSVIHSEPAAGTWVSTDGDAFGYYMRNDPQLEWQSSSYAYSLFGQPTYVTVSNAMSGEFAGIVYRTDDVGAGVAATELQLTERLKGDRQYRLLTRLRVDRYHKAFWYVWEKV